MVDRGLGVPRVYQTPSSIRPIRSRPIPTSPSWRTRRTTTPGRCSATRPTSSTQQWELDAAIRYDEDSRAEHHRHADAVPARRDPHGSHRRGAQADLRRSAAQGHAALQADRQPHPLRRLEPRISQRRLQPDRCGRRRAADGHLGVNDLFQAEVADTWEVGAKSQFLDRRLSANLAIFHTDVAQRLLLLSSTPRPRLRISAISMPPTRAPSSS